MKPIAYPQYKDSGIEWLGEIPEHWVCMRVKNVATMQAGVGITSDAIEDSGEYPVYGGNALRGYTMGFTRTGNVVLVGRQGALCGNVNYASGQFWASEHAVVVGPSEDVDVRWLGETLRSMKLNDYSVAAAQPGLAVDRILVLGIAVPPEQEQHAIADFLDRETAKIDALVEKKERLIELLQEKRTALITHAVTKGLDPDAPMKDSGIEWLGQIPTHWETTSIRYQFDNLDHRRIPISNEDRAPLEKIYPYYGASGIIDYVDEYLFDEPLVLVAEDGANLLSRSTPLAFLASGKYWVNNHAHILRPRTGDIRYWVGVLQTFDYTPLISGAAQPKLTGDRLGVVQVPLPPGEEQVAIAEHLNRETAKIDALIAKVGEAIERLNEYRTALISAAVTGKIDVRSTT